MAKSKKFVEVVQKLRGKDQEIPEKQTEYIIYVRKSTDEKSGRQSQSIPDQIMACMNYAKQRGLNVRKKPKNFEFETEEEIHREDNDPDIKNREIYKETRKFYIIKEQKSAKQPYVREKWRLLIKKIKLGEIKGIISYSPNRQARNMLEGGELLDLIDDYGLSLKYTNFEFDNSASGKMMLGFWFVFSTHYSNDLSETVGRGFKSRVTKGKALRAYNKLGYIIEDGYHKPYEPCFKYVKEAFHKKVYDNATDQEIIKYLKKYGVTRIDIQNKDGKGLVNEMDVNKTYINDIWKDPFYYGLHIYGKNQTDLNENNPFFEPVITEEEYDILLNRYLKKVPHQGKKTIKDEHNELIPIPEGMIITKDNYTLTFNIPNKKRFNEKLTQLKKSNPKARLLDVVDPHQIKFRCANKNSKYYGLTINFDIIDEAISKKLQTFKIDEEQYNKYVNYMKNDFSEKQEENIEKRKVFQLQLNKLVGNKNKFIEKNLGYQKTKDEEKIYKKKIEQFNNDIELVETELSNIKIDENNNIELFENFVEMLQNLHRYYKKATYVQKRNLCKILFLNIMVTSQNQVLTNVRHGLEGIFNNNIGQSKENRIGTDNGGAEDLRVPSYTIPLQTNYKL